MRSRALFVAVALPAWWIIFAASPAHGEPPQFGVEVELGTGAGLTPYLRNEVRTEEDRTRTDEQGRSLLRPFLADVQTGASTGSTVRLVTSNIAAGVSVRWFDLYEERRHHRGTDLISRDRLRPDGTVDDSGVEYETLRPETEETIPEDERDSLFVFGLEGDYRFLWPGEAFDFFVPVGAGLMMTHVTRPASPYRLGLQGSSGLGVGVDFGGGFSLVATGKLHGVATPHYGRRSDSAYRSATIGESTESAYFSTLLYATANLALQFHIR